VVILQPVNLRWIHGVADDPKDLCAHGDIEFRIGEDVLLASFQPSRNARTVEA
jgi:hypothetical protein